GQLRDLLATQPGRAPPRPSRQPDVARPHAGAPIPQKLGELRAIHDSILGRRCGNIQGPRVPGSAVLFFSRVLAASLQFHERASASESESSVRFGASWRRRAKRAGVVSENRIALVTGANKGIGFEIARALGRDHGMTVLVGARDEVRGKEAAERLGAFAVPVPLDVTSPASISALAERLQQSYGRLHVLVNNAGILRGRDAALEETFATNVFGVVAVTSVLLPLLRA